MNSQAWQMFCGDLGIDPAALVAANHQGCYLKMCEERIRPDSGRIWSSPVLADGKLYFVSQYKGAFVVAAQPKFELLAHNVFEDDDSRTNASPAVSNGQLLLRTDRFLYCIGSK